MDYAKEYSHLHEKYPKYFAGFTIKRYVNDIAHAVSIHRAKTLLDYGSGKGYQYLLNRVHDKFDPCPHCGRGLLPKLFDLGVRQISEKPTGTFDGVICTDMLEHIEEADVPRILADILSLAGKFIVLGISCRPETKDVKQLSDGRGVHVTVKPPKWWAAQIRAVKRADNSIVVYCIYELPDAPLERETIT